jgi:hypothetical protein
MILAADRAGKAKLSTLLLLVLLAAGGYYAFAFGSVYWRRYTLTDAVEGQLAYAGQLADESIRQQIVDKIVAMNLPRTARRVRLVRTSARTIEVSIKYTETVNLLFRTKDIPVSITRRRTY